MTYSGFSSLLVWVVLVCDIRADELKPTVTLLHGTITGNLRDVSASTRIEEFLGIPYAKPPVGNLRFAYPEPFGQFGELQANKYAEMCIQNPLVGPPQYRKTVVGSEDCLYLNIFRKNGIKEGDNKQVIVMIHGGAFRGGSGSEAFYSGIPFVLSHEMIVVNINYRLGILGFADMKDLAPGNLGLFDQRLALEWIQQNIRSFGGDPDNVTLMGVSAGSMSVSAQIISPLNRGKKLFHSALMDGGVLVPGNAVDQQESMEKVRKVAELLECPNEGQAMLACLRDADASRLTELSDVWDSWIWSFRPTMDGKFLPRDLTADLRDNSADYMKVKMLIGYAKDEGTMFAGSSLGDSVMPNIRNENDFVEHLAKISKGNRYDLDFREGAVREKVVDLFYKKTQSLFNDSAAFVREGTFSCGTNVFVKRYARTHKDVYVYHFERMFSGDMGSIDRTIPGVMHASPFLFMTGGYLVEVPLFPSFKADDKDKAFIDDLVEMVVGFINSEENLTFRSVKVPDFSVTREIISLDDKPYVRSSLLHEAACKSLFGYLEPSSSSARDEL